MKVVIFGSNGQDGYFLSRLLREKNIEVTGLGRANSDIIGSVADYMLVESVIKSLQPDFVFHFAANSTTRHDVLWDNHAAISTGTLNVLEAVRKHSPHTKIFLSGSALQFKNEGMPISENTPFDASSAYSVARIHSVYTGRYYRNTFGLNVYVGYFCNHDSPLRSEKHVNQKIAAAVKRISRGSDEKIEIGNANVLKEFNYAGDAVEAVWTLVNQNQVFEAMIGCGEAHSIREWTEYCFNKINKDWKDHVVEKKGFVSEYNILVSDSRLIRSLGWRPKVGFYQLADQMMDAL